MKIGFLFFSFLILIFSVSCGDIKTTEQTHQGSLRQRCYDDGTCNEGLTCVSDVCVDLSEIEDKDVGTNDEVEDLDDYDNYTEPDNNTNPDNETVDENDPYDGCDTESITKNCSLDNECGNCNICVSGKCSKGCETDNDCKMYTGLKCNKKLNRCTNVYASLQACGETKCPTGCCYAGKGMTSVKCLTTPAAYICGLCANGEIYMPEDSKCIPAVCSTVSDNCPTLNSDSTDIGYGCFECKSGEFICKEIETGCDSSGFPVNVATCIPAGEECVSGPISDCCSGLPCIDGYCY